MNKQLNILLVDDDHLITTLHLLNVKRAGISHQVTPKSDGREALNFLDDKAAESDNTHFLILLDINMPVMDGWEFLDRIQDRPYCNRLTVVMVTSSIDESDKLKSETYDQVVDYIEKPLMIHHLEELKKLEPLIPFFP